MRNIIVGDIHGCLDEFDELLALVGYRKGRDELILVGDLIDRGPNSPGVIRRAREVEAKCVRANHEEAAIRYLSHEAKKKEDPYYINPMRPRHADRLAQWASIREEDWDWLRSLPYFIKFANGWVAVHAGARGGLQMEHQDTNELIRIRYVSNETGKMIPLEIGEEPVNSHPWYEEWRSNPFVPDEKHVVYGHHVYPKVHINGTWKTGLSVGIDTGCCFGMELTAMIIEPNWEFSGDLTFVNVKAKEAYSNLRTSWTANTK